jgi:fibronectin type 3 domain-containing protein
MNHARTSRNCASILRTVAAGIVVAAISVVSAVSAGAATYYVSPIGSDTNPGSATAPFRQIRRALTSVVPGDKVLVSDGNYLGFNVSGINGTSTAPITVQAVGSAAVVTPTTDRSDNRDTIFVTYSSYVVLDGLTSSNANRAAVRIDNSPNITVRRGVFGNNATWGIFTDFSDNLLLEQNECYGSKSQHGIYVSNTCVNPAIRNNRLHDNYACGLHMNGDVSQGGAGIISGAVIEGNIVYNNGVGGGSGINMDGVQNSVVKNNLLYNNHASGISAYRIDASSGPAGLQILNNTVDMAANARWALRLDSTQGAITVRNNILNNRNPAHGGISFTTATDVANTNSAYNILDYVTPDDGNTRYTLTQWLALGHEPSSFSATPAALWVSSAAADYHLLSSAPAVDHGQNVLGLSNDLDGNSRPQGASTDIGCYEYPVAAVPAAPANLAAAAGNGQITLTWTASSGAASYSVYRATTSGGEGATPVKTGLTGTTLTDTGLTNGVTYFYQVTAVSAQGESARSNEASAMPKQPAPSAPTGLTATARTNQVALSWTASAGAASYNLYRSTAAGGEGTTPYKTGLISTSYGDSAVTPGTRYYYMVTAVNASGESARSAEASAIPLPAAPAVPTGLTATAGNTTVSLSWSAGAGATTYNVKRATVSGGPYTTVASVPGTNYTNTGLTNGTTYYYVVSAINAGGESANSAQASATPQATASNAATFVVLDAATRGNWKGVYGADGYSIAQLSGGTSLPAYASLSVSGNYNYTWSASTTDARALQKPAASDRIASCWYGSTFIVDVNLTDGQAHNVAFYVLDWDTNARMQRIDVLDAATDVALNTQTVSSFNGGKYLVWSIKGHVKLRFTRTAGANTVLSGVFFR